MLREVQLKVVLILLDNEGHAEWNLAKYLDVSDSYLNPHLLDLKREKLVFRKLRKSKRKVENDKCEISEKKRKGKTRNGDYGEIAYYLVKDLDVFRAIIQELISFQAVPNPKILAGFLLKGILESKYAEELINTYGKDAVVGVVKNELGNDYDYFIEKFFKVDLRVAYVGTFIAEEMTLTGGESHKYICEDPITDLDHWYCRHVGAANPEELPYLMSAFTVIRSKREELRKLIEVLRST